MPIKTPESKMKFEWEKCGKLKQTNRAKTIGGWIVLNSNNTTSSMAFIPDPYHKWEIEK
jgi:hypothetical protein